MKRNLYLQNPTEVMISSAFKFPFVLRVWALKRAFIPRFEWLLLQLPFDLKAGVGSCVPKRCGAGAHGLRVPGWEERTFRRDISTEPWRGGGGCGSRGAGMPRDAAPDSKTNPGVGALRAAGAGPSCASPEWLGAGWMKRHKALLPLPLPFFSCLFCCLFSVVGFRIHKESLNL